MCVYIYIHTYLSIYLSISLSLSAQRPCRVTEWRELRWSYTRACARARVCGGVMCFCLHTCRYSTAEHSCVYRICTCRVFARSVDSSSTRITRIVCISKPSLGGHVCIHIYIYIYTYTHIIPLSHLPARPPAEDSSARQGGADCGHSGRGAKRALTVVVLERGFGARGNAAARSSRARRIEGSLFELCPKLCSPVVSVLRLPLLLQKSRHQKASTPWSVPACRAVLRIFPELAASVQPARRWRSSLSRRCPAQRKTARMHSRPSQPRK